MSINYRLAAAFILPMRWNVLVPLFCSLLIVSPGCKKREKPLPVPRTSQESTQTQIDVCGLLTKEEIEAIQGSPIKETKSSTPSDGAFRVSQCFYTATEFSKSVSLAVKEESVPPKKIDGIGEEAFWASNRFGGMLYVLKGDAFIFISLGGPDDEETKIDKSKALAQKALQRLALRSARG